MKTFTAPSLPFSRAAKAGRVRMDWRKHRFVATCEGCSATCDAVDRYGNTFRTQAEWDDFAHGNDPVHGPLPHYSRHMSAKRVRCELSNKPMGSDRETA